MDNNEILQAIDSAVKGITTPTSMGDSLLNADQFDNFVRTIQDSSIILNEARYQEMDSEKMDIDRIAFMSRVLNAGGATNNLSEDDFAEPSTNTNKLSAEELMAVVGLKDHTVRRNIEKDQLEDTIIELLGEAAGRDMEEFGLFANTAIDPTSYGASYINLTEGWANLAGNKLFNTDTDVFSDTAEAWPENLFDAMLEALPKKYIQNRGDWRFYVTWEIEKAYRDLLKSRGTSLGDRAQTQHIDLYYDGIPVVYVPMFERYTNRTAMLQNPDNMVWGVFHDVTLETEREAKKRRTDFVLTFEGDTHYEDEDACVVAFDEDGAASDFA